MTTTGMVMAAAVLGLAVPGGLRVGNAATVGKTFPAFTAAWSRHAGAVALSPARRPRRLDEDDVRVRPGPGLAAPHPAPARALRRRPRRS